MSTRSQRRRIPALPAECWIIIADSLSRHDANTVRLLGCEVAQKMQAGHPVKEHFVYILQHGRLFVRVTTSDGIWKIVCIDSEFDGRLYSSGCLSSCRVSKWAFAAAPQPIRCGPFSLTVTSNGATALWQIRHNDFCYIWHMGERLCHVLREHFVVNSIGQNIH